MGLTVDYNQRGYRAGKGHRAHSMLNSSRTRLTQVAQWALTLLVAGAIIAILVPQREQLAALLQLTPALLAGLSITVLAQFVTNGFVLKYFFEHFRAIVSIRETVVIGLMDATLNYLPMKAGTVATGAVALKRYNVRVSEYAAIVAGATVLNLWVCGLFSGVLLFPSRTPLGLTLVLAPSVVLAALLWWGRTHAVATGAGGRFRQAMTRAVRGVQSIFGDHRLLIRLTITNIVRLLAVSGQLYFSFRAVSTPITFAEAVIIGGFATVLGRLSIIPGGLGFREGGVVAAASLVGIDPTVALAASMIDRAAIMVWLALLGLPSSVYVTRTTTWSGYARGPEESSDTAADAEPTGDASGASPADVPTGNVYDKYGTSNPIASRMVATFIQELEEVRRIAAPASQLDVGCGEGALTAEWARTDPGARIVGVDLDDDRLKEAWAELRADNLEFACASAMELPYEDDSFDTVSAIEVLEHVPDPRRALHEIARVGSRFAILSVPREPLWRALNMARGSYWSDLGNTPGHIHHWSMREFVALAEEIGSVREVRTPTPWTILLVDLGEAQTSA
jgi:ubiquinone/menaquinone biosynthesis C-methylase UbiE/uncharacterized membrane protein YbhN (UPF0104 family)